MLTKIDRRPWLWLLVGVALFVAAHLRWGVGLLAWVAPVPFLRYLRVTAGWRSRLTLVLALFAAAFFAVAKIVTAPIPVAIALGFAVPVGLLGALPYLGHSWLARRLTPGVGVLVFPALVAIVEWIQHALTPFGVWTAAAHTQHDDLPLLQLAAVTGAVGVSFLVSLVASVLEGVLANGLQPLRRAATWTATVLALVHVGGAVRLTVTEGTTRPTVRVAAVGTDSTVGGPGGLPSRQVTDAWEARIFERTRRAAALGARLAVWTEVATLVRPEDEPAFERRVSALAEANRIDIVAAYVVPRSVAPFSYENKYLYLRADGTRHHVYHKLHPVPTEPIEAGPGPSPVVATAFGNVAGAICYDYDFPSLARALATAGADLVALPSSDWRGIDPLHTRMAAVRAIESGHSILRSARWGLSAGIDPEGRMRGRRSHFDDPDRLLMVSLPRTGVVTPYAVLGDWFPLLCAIAVAAGAVGRLRAQRRESAAAPGAGGLSEPELG